MGDILPIGSPLTVNVFGDTRSSSVIVVPSAVPMTTSRPKSEISTTTAQAGRALHVVVRRDILERVNELPAAAGTRVDRWLCAVRLAKTRPLATRLCEGGHVLVNGLSAKPSTKVRVGDRVEAFIADRQRIVEVTRTIESRVGADVAATCYVDRSPPVIPKAEPAMMRVRGEGRPSKRVRREFERLRRAADA